MDGLRWPVASSRRDYTQSVRGQAMHFFCQLVATELPRVRCGSKLVSIAEAHMRRTHARAGAIGVCGVLSIHLSMDHATSCQHFYMRAHISEAHMPGRVLYRILNLGGVLKYEWGSGSAEPERRAPPRMAQPCWGWVREGGRPLPQRGSGGITPGKI
jgi:hypothetical protein